MVNFINIIFFGLLLLCWIIIIKKLIQNRFAPVKSAEAEVIDKYKNALTPVFHGSFKRERYIVVFLTENKKRSFGVSEFSFANYKINDKGTLKYKGNQIISFK